MIATVAEALPHLTVSEICRVLGCARSTYYEPMVRFVQGSKSHGDRPFLEC